MDSNLVVSTVAWCDWKLGRWSKMMTREDHSWDLWLVLTVRLLIFVFTHLWFKFMSKCTTYQFYEIASQSLDGQQCGLETRMSLVQIVVWYCLLVFGDNNETIALIFQSGHSPDHCRNIFKMSLIFIGLAVYFFHCLSVSAPYVE